MVKLIFIGTGAADCYGSKRHGMALYFNKLLLDCSAGTIERLEDLHLDQNIHNVLLTHLHSDHISGIWDLIVRLAIRLIRNNRKGVLRVFSPPGFEILLNAYQKTDSIPNALLNTLRLEIVTIKDKQRFKVEGNEITVFQMRHSIPDFGYLIRFKGKSLFYSGDTAFSREILSKIKADILLYEANFPAKDWKMAESVGHSTVEQAAEAARLINAKKLFLIHVNDSYFDSKIEMIKEARKTFKNTIVPNDLDEFDL